MTVDGIDFKINEPTPFSSRWFSHKHNHAGVRYEIAVCIQTGWIVHYNGPFAAGIWPDAAITKMGLTDMVNEDEKLLADGGYSGEEFSAWMETPNGRNDADQRMKQVARSRHEAINGWLVKFDCLFDEYHHSLDKHGLVFGAVANLVQLKIMKNGPPFMVEYNDVEVPLKYESDGDFKEMMQEW